MSQRIVTVFGGSGFLGRHIVRRLAQAGFRVRVAVRRPHVALFLKPMGDVGQIQLLQADITDEASVAKAVAGASDVVNLVGIPTEGWGRHFDAIHAEGAAIAAKAARAAGARHFIQMSSIGVDAESPAHYARSKAEGEAAVRDAFPGATILRPSIVFGPEDNFFNRFASMARFLPLLPLIGGGQTKFQPVFAGDVAAAVHAALTNDNAAGRTFELGGPAVYTFRELLEMILRITERRRALVDHPFAIAKLNAYVLQFAPAPMTLTSDQVEMLKSDNIVGAGGPDCGTFADLGIAPASPEAIVPTYLVRFRRAGQFATAR